MPTEYWLGTADRDQYGNAQNPALHDGPHDDPQGVVTAKALYSRIFRDDRDWVMIVVSDVPDIEPDFDEESADICAEAVAEHRVRRGVPLSADEEIARDCFDENAER